MVPDASVLVSLFSRADVHHTATRRWYGSYAAAGGGIVVPLLALSEVAGAVARRSGDRAIASEAVGELRRLSRVSLVAEDYSLAVLAARLAADLHLRGADAVYVALALREGVPLVTWDREQRERAAVVMEARTPT